MSGLQGKRIALLEGRMQGNWRTWCDVMAVSLTASRRSVRKPLHAGSRSAFLDRLGEALSRWSSV